MCDPALDDRFNALLKGWNIGCCIRARLLASQLRGRQSAFFMFEHSIRVVFLLWGSSARRPSARCVISPSCERSRPYSAHHRPASCVASLLGSAHFRTCLRSDLPFSPSRWAATCFAFFLFGSPGYDLHGCGSALASASVRSAPLSQSKNRPRLSSIATFASGILQKLQFYATKELVSSPTSIIIQYPIC